MFKKVDRKASRQKKQMSIRNKISGTPERPRLSVYRSNTHLYTQIIDDVKQTTLVAANTQELNLGKNKEAASQLGKLIAEKAKKAGITKVVFDRSGYLYHGKIKTLAEAARENGLEF